MFSAFSFGKIIKTILPGAILTLGLLLLIEDIWAVLGSEAGFLLGKVPKDWITATSAALVPLALILGFFLNTFVWLKLNPRMRNLSDKQLSATIYPGLREKLSTYIWDDTARHLFTDGQNRIDSSKGKFPLEYYYIPVVTITNLNYLWESYFCWYEFAINSACAVVLPVLAAIPFLWLRFRHYHFLTFSFMVLTVGAALCRMLWSAAVKNLTRYEQNLMLLIVASLEKTESLPVRNPLANEK